MHASKISTLILISNIDLDEIQPQPLGFMKLMLISFCTSDIQGRTLLTFSEIHIQHRQVLGHL